MGTLAGATPSCQRVGTGPEGASAPRRVAFVGLGSNLGDPAEILAGACRALASADGVYALRRSSLYGTRPVGDVPQDDYLNAVLRVETTLPPLALLELLLDVERRFGRRRLVRWGPRTLDLDLLFYDDQVVDHPRLTVPHPELHRRGFVLIPLAELAPDLRHPTLQRSVSALRDAWRRSVEDPAAEVWPAAPERTGLRARVG